MIKINLLESVTDKQHGAAVAVERRVASPMSRLLLMSLAVTGLLLVVIGWDVISTQMAKSDAEKELENQKQIATQLEAVMKEQKDLEQKISNIDGRINAIKKLRSTQAGPSAVLEALKERIASNPGLYLDSVEQKGEQLTISGNSPDESVVTQFGRSLEFSGGLFSNLNIETQRKDSPLAQTTSADANAPSNQIVNFTIHCAYTPSKAGAGADNSSGAMPANAPASPSAPNAPQAANNPPSNLSSAPNSGNANPPQVARK
ncbi:MAG: PilN domain-containing protein [Pyrinomonadaceae bacterium]